MRKPPGNAQLVKVVIKVAISLGQQTTRVSSLHVLFIHEQLCLCLQRWALATEVQWTTGPYSIPSLLFSNKAEHQPWCCKERSTWGAKSWKSVFWDSLGLRVTVSWRSEKAKASQEEWRKRKKGEKRASPALPLSPSSTPPALQMLKQPCSFSKVEAKLQSLVEMRHFSSFKTDWCLV